MCELTRLLPLADAMDSSCLATVVAILSQDALNNNWDHRQYCHCYLQIPLDQALEFDCLPVAAATQTLLSEYRVCQDLATSATTGEPGVVTSAPELSIPEVLALHPRGHFTTFLTAMQGSGLADVLRTSGPYTVLAPLNAAFDAVDLNGYSSPELLHILGFHIIAGRFKIEDFLDGEQIETQAGQFLTFRQTPDGAWTVSGADDGVPARLVAPMNILASNGVVHGIDRVLVPSDLVLEPITSGSCTDAADMQRVSSEAATSFDVGNLVGNELPACVTGGTACLHDRFFARGYTSACSGCFANYGLCGLNSCLLQCLADLDSPECHSCAAAACYADFTDCSAGATPTLPTDRPSPTALIITSMVPSTSVSDTRRNSNANSGDDDKGSSSLTMIIVVVAIATVLVVGIVIGVMVISRNRAANPAGAASSREFSNPLYGASADDAIFAGRRTSSSDLMSPGAQAANDSGYMDVAGDSYLGQPFNDDTSTV